MRLAILKWVIKEIFTDKVTFERRFDAGEEVTLDYIWEMGSPGKRNSKFMCPEAAMCLVCLMNR